MAFLPFFLPLKPDVSLPQNPATSIPIPDPFLPTEYPPDDCPQTSDFILVLFFQLAYGKSSLFSHRGEGRMASFHSSRAWEFKSLWVQEYLLTPHPGFSSCISKTRDRALQPCSLPKMGFGCLCSWTAVMWCICNLGSALGKEVHDKGLNDPLGNSTPSRGSCTGTQPCSLPELCHLPAWVPRWPGSIGSASHLLWAQPSPWPHLCPHKPLQNLKIHTPITPN